MQYITFLLALSGGALVHAVRINRPLSSEEPASVSEAGKDAAQKAASDNVTIASYSDGLCQAMEGLSNTTIPGDGSCLSLTNARLTDNIGISFNNTVGGLRLFFDDKCTPGLNVSVSAGFSRKFIRCYNIERLGNDKPFLSVRALPDVPPLRARSASALGGPPPMNQPKPKKPTVQASIATYTDPKCKEIKEDPTSYTDGSCLPITPGEYSGIRWGKMYGSNLYSDSTCDNPIAQVTSDMRKGGPGSCFNMSTLAGGPVGSMSMFGTSKMKRRDALKIPATPLNAATVSQVASSEGTFAAYPNTDCTGETGDPPWYLGGTATGLCIIITPKYDTIGIKWKEVKGLHFYSDFHCGNSAMNVTSTMFPHKIQGAAGSCFSMGQNGGQYWSMMVSDTSDLEPREARHHKPKTRPQPPASTPTGPDPYFVPMLCCP